MPPKKTKSPNTVAPAAVAKGKKQLAKVEPEPETKVVTKTAPQKEEKKVEVKPEPTAAKSTAKAGSVKSEPKYTAAGDFQGALGDGKFGKDKVLVASWNVNGIRAVQKKGELEAYIKQVQPDVLCLNESKIDTEAFKSDPSIGKMIPSDYQQFWNFCKNKKGYAGSAIFSKVPPISVTYDIGVKKHDQEGRTITVEFQTFFVVVCYVPNAGQGLDRLGYRVKEWDIDFQAYLNGLKAKKHVVLCGDLNVCHEEIDIAKPKGNEKSAGFTKEERAGFSNFLTQGWTDSFRKKYPTKVQYSYWNLRSGARKINQGWRLDYFVIDDDLYTHVIDSSINNDIFGSDHCPIELTLNNKTLKS